MNTINAKKSPMTILKQHNFRMFWLGQGISLLGDSFYVIALPLLALELSGGSGVALGTALMFASIPRAVLMLFGGAIADQFSPRRVMMTTNWLNALTIGVLAILLFSGNGTLWQLYLASLLLGIADAFYFPAAGSIMPFIVDKQDLQVGNSVYQLSQRLLFLVGPALAGLLIAAVGIPTALVIDVVTFLIANFFLSIINIRERKSSLPVTEHLETQDKMAKTDIPQEKVSIIGSILQGIRYVKNDGAVLSLMLLIAAIDFGTAGSIRVGLPILLDVVFNVGAAALGFMISAFGAGALVGTLIMSRLQLNNIGYLFLGLIVTFSVTFLLSGLVLSLWLIALMLAIAGIAAGVFNIASVSWLQGRTDDALIGRVMSLVMLSSVGIMPLAQLICGFLAEIDPTLPFTVSGSLMLSVAVIVASRKSFRQLTIKS